MSTTTSATEDASTSQHASIGRLDGWIKFMRSAGLEPEEFARRLANVFRDIAQKEHKANTRFNVKAVYTFLACAIEGKPLEFSKLGVLEQQITRKLILDLNAGVKKKNLSECTDYLKESGSQKLKPSILNPLSIPKDLGDKFDGV